MLKGTNLCSRHFVLNFGEEMRIQESTNIYGKYVAVLLSFVLFLTQGCGSSKINRLQTLKKDTIVGSNQGIVIARVVNASGSFLPFNGLTLTPENVNESDNNKFQRLQSLNPEMNGTTVFASPVSIGNYSLNSISSYFFNGEYRLSRYARPNAKFGTFEVKPNQVTDLGTIVYYTKPQDDKYLEMLLHSSEVSYGEVLDKHFSFYKYEKENVLGWNENGLEEEHQSQFFSAAQNPKIFKKTYFSPDKSLYFLGKLGFFIKRTNFGDWELDAVDTNLDLTAITENKNGDLVIGGAEGRLFLKRSGKEWEDISLGFNYHILNLSFEKPEEITMLAKTTSELFVLRAAIDTPQINWREINKYDSIRGWKNSNISRPSQGNKKRKERIHNASISEIGDRNYIRIATKSLYSGPIFSITTKDVFSFDKDTWEVSEVDSGVDITTVLTAGATMLGIEEAGFWSWDGKSTYYRYVKDSDSWDKIKTRIYNCNDDSIVTKEGCSQIKGKVKRKSISFDFHSVPWFKNNLEAIAIVGLSSSERWGKEPKIISTLDGGKTWFDTKRKLPKEYCSNLITQVTDRLLLGCNGATGDFYESTDEGATWKHVRQQENF